MWNVRIVDHAGGDNARTVGHVGRGNACIDDNVAVGRNDAASATMGDAPHNARIGDDVGSEAFALYDNVDCSIGANASPLRHSSWMPRPDDTRRRVVVGR